MPIPPPQHPALKVIVLVLITVAYFLAGKIGLGFATVHVSASPVWAPAGIAIALLAKSGGASIPSTTSTGRH